VARLFFGEIAMLEPLTRTAPVSAKTPLRFFVVGEHAFRTLLDTDPAIERKLLRAVVRRLVSLMGDPTLS
jgi:CRP-like cAMP-binding protein